ncbi:chemokine XC receptor 1-like [Carassius auratus]|uniref:Chemokine XC receptor 1-like n=1 Tax=Carassius auratus TaxID=7957 RepID=A0A6P6M704_CARAU|nr:chemokine XC receptor 1-like [Carassius auratus]XP_026108381.1 chemokine XC receptor 1-like [Carassius auratus]XP_052397353.1 chemokine XC receptor 1-like [Carassius gibelio]
MTEDYTSIEPEDQLCHKEEVVKIGSIVIPVYFALLVVFSCIGNLLVLVILVLYEKFRLLINILILNLAVADLLFTFGLPFWASYYIWGWTFGEVGCKAVKFLFYLGFYSSVLFLTVMTVQRYMAVVHPLSDWERCRGFSVAPFIVWILSGTAALLISFHSQVLEHEGVLYCEFDSIPVKHAAVYLQNVFFLIAFCIMGFCQVRMFQRITQSRTKRRHKSIKLIFSIGLVFFIGWAPYNIVMFLRIQQDNGLSSFMDCNVSIRLDYAFYACRLLAFSPCCLNPVLYALIGEKFQKHLKTILKKMC